MKVYDLDNEEEFREFAKGSQRPLKVYGTDRYVAYDPQKRIGVMISKAGSQQGDLGGRLRLRAEPARQPPVKTAKQKNS